ncbi:TetR/AcrR family transcriptional regulator [Tumidithrix elongata RA019]|uniref:TetR/AcrR family transcriptional regulator n=1 Tax=Tumidithrix elongata BACA0141 TaxID=2716417 RepID=A0AAW9Q016_9CYAN|nr:TetR/AcrR family transcriptional regulator [Tumidithrix elongata RA019]
MIKSKGIERELSPEKTELILAGAMREFLEHGYAGARIDKIVEAAGVSKATVYRHFPDKEALFTALIQQMSCRKELFRLQNLQSYEEEPIAFLKQYAAGMLDNVAEDPQILTFLRIIIGESGRFPELARAFVTNMEKTSLDFLTEYFKTHPKLQIADPEVTARAFIGTLIHFVMIRDVLQSGDIMPMERDRLLNSLLALIVTNP